MKIYKAYLFDLDGTVCRGNEPIPEAVTFIHRLNERRIPYLFVTNNATATNIQFAKKLQGFGIPCEPKDVLTSAMAAAGYLREKKAGADVLAIGEEGLLASLRSVGFNLNKKNPDVVVVGLDRRVTYEKLADASLAVRAGATFIATNPDAAIPTDRGLLPGNGAIVAAISTATGQTPIFIGKPEPIIIEQALKLIGASAEETLLIGDNYNTDIRAGLRTGVDTLLVFSGVTTKGDLTKVDAQPTYCVDSLEDWPVA